MLLDEIIQKYGMHELDIDCCKAENGLTAVYAYCHRHNVDGEFMVNHYLKITGNFTVLKTDFAGTDDVYIHMAWIEKMPNGTYEINGVGGCMQFSVNGDLLVKELSEQEYDAVIHAED